MNLKKPKFLNIPECISIEINELKIKYKYKNKIPKRTFDLKILRLDF